MQIVSVRIDLGKTTFHLVALGVAGKVRKSLETASSVVGVWVENLVVLTSEASKHRKHRQRPKPCVTVDTTCY